MLSMDDKDSNLDDDKRYYAIDDDNKSISLNMFESDDDTVCSDENDELYGTICKKKRIRDHIKLKIQEKSYLTNNAETLLDNYFEYPDSSILITCPDCGEQLVLSQHYTAWCNNCAKEFAESTDFYCTKIIPDKGYIHTKYRIIDEEILISLLYVLTYDDEVSYTKILLIVNDKQETTYYQPHYIDCNVENDIDTMDFSKDIYNRKLTKYASWFHFKHIGKENNVDITKINSMFVTNI